MKILFFHRLELTDLYAPASKYLANEHEILHVAFSSKEYDLLLKKYDISVNLVNFTELRDLVYDTIEYTQKEIKELDTFIIENTNKRFSLNSSISLDRTYENLNYENACKMSLVYYKTWNIIFEKFTPTLFFHEPPALFMTHIAAIICKKSNSYYLAQIHVLGINRYQWIFVEGDSASPIEIKIQKEQNKNKLPEKSYNTFIENFKKDGSILLGNLIKKNINKRYKNLLFIKSVLALFVKTFIKNLKSIDKIHPKQHIEKYLELKSNGAFIDFENLYSQAYSKVYNKPEINDRYYFYPLHLEPEAVVLYYADGWYKGQVKLIENIAAQLPPNTYLYVKDHPHGGTYRNAMDLKILKKILNIKIIDPAIPGKQLISNSLGVITINGTAGFEALLMNKHVVTFGNAFYSDFEGVINIKHIKELRDVLYGLENKNPTEYNINEIKLFLDSSHSGFVNYFSGNQNNIDIDLEENIEIVAEGLKKFILRLNTKNIL